MMEWHKPTTIESTLQLAAEYGEEGKLLAGGTWLALILKQGLLMPNALISLHDVSGIKSIQYDPNVGLRIGAMVSLREMELSEVVKAYFPELAYTCGVVANVRIRNQATVGGCLCDADYASDPPGMFVALNARAILQSSRGKREIAMRDFIVGHYSTIIEPDELLIEVIVPMRSAETTKGIYLKYRSRSNEDRPCVGVSAVADLDSNGICRDLKVVIGAVADTPQIVDDAAALAVGNQLTNGLIKQIAGGYADSIDPLSDIRGTSWYRTQMINVHVKRALQQLGGVS